MKLRPLILLTCLAAVIFSLDANAAAKPSYYLIGNSLTWDTVPPKLDGDVQWHVDCGKSLPFIQQNPAKPCVKTSTLWPKALKEKQYGFVSVQTHYGASLKQDADAISLWIKMQPKAVFVIHSGWARSKSRADEYANKAVAEKMEHSPAYLGTLVKELKRRHPGRKFRQTHAQDLLAKIAADIARGKAPWKDITEIYRDAIHMNTVTGRYLMHNAMRHALGQSRSAEGFQKLDSKLKAYFDSILDQLGDAAG
jgi:hypothetical protein